MSHWIPFYRTQKSNFVATEECVDPSQLGEPFRTAIPDEGEGDAQAAPGGVPHTLTVEASLNDISDKEGFSVTEVATRPASLGFGKSLSSWFSFSSTVLEDPVDQQPQAAKESSAFDLSNQTATAPEAHIRKSSFWWSYSSPIQEDSSQLPQPVAVGDAVGRSPPSKSYLWFSYPAAETSNHCETERMNRPEYVESSEPCLNDVVTDSLQRGKYFSLLEVAELPPEKTSITCCNCARPFSDYIIVSDNGSYWHAKCFATVVCPEECDCGRGDVGKEGLSGHQEGGKQGPVNLSKSCSFSEDGSEAGHAQGCEGSTSEDAFFAGVLDMSQAISWAVSEECRFSTDVVVEVERELISDGNSRANISGAEGGSGDDEAEMGPEARETVEKNSKHSLGDSDRELNNILMELDALGTFEHQYCQLGSSSKETAAQLEEETEAWNVKVGNALDRSLLLFNSGTYSSQRDFIETSSFPVSATSHAPPVMKGIRLRFGITTAEYASSFRPGSVEGGDKGEGKSGKRMWFTKDRRFVVKVISNQEFSFLNRILPSYYNHVVSNGSHTLLCRFMGLYTITLWSGYPTRVVVMNNVFYHPPSPIAPAAYVVMDEVYDLKGSAINRCVTDDDIKAGVSVMKDLNFCLNHNGTDTQGRPIYASNGPGVCRKLPMDAAYTSMLRADVLNDCTWLAEAGIMDYSMMVGIGHLEFSTSTEKPSRRRSTPDGPDIFRRRSAPRPRMAKKSNSISFLKIDTNVEDLASITAECGDCSRSIDCNSNSIHSSLQNVVQSVPWRSVWQEHWGGVSCVCTKENIVATSSPASAPSPSTSGRRKISAGEPVIVFIGIIDILQEYNLLKRIETAYKMKLLSTLGQDPSLISAVDAQSYSDRFRAFIDSHL